MLARLLFLNKDNTAKAGNKPEDFQICFSGDILKVYFWNNRKST
jgi:hypothetical protein